jgi:anti-sigma-K factor RskA
VYEELSSVDQRLGELQSQLDRLTVSLQLWREQQDHLQPAEQRLAELTRQCAEIVAQWSVTGDRQARAVSELEERVSAFSAAEERLHRDAAARLRTLERAIEQEWSALRQLHHDPVAELKEQAATLGEVSIAAANTSLSTIERTEARLAQLEQSLNDRLTVVSRQLESAVAEIRGRVPSRQLPDAAPSWPIEGVVRLHNQLRSPETGDVITESAAPSGSRAIARALPAHDETPDATPAAIPVRRRSRSIVLAATAAVLVVVFAAATSFLVRRQARAAVAEAATARQQAQTAIAEAASRLEAARTEAAREVAQAREGSARAQMVSDVLASPDLVRFNIAGGGPGAIAGQLLWSRSRGVVFSALRVPPAPPRMTYQLWLLTDAAPVTAGTFTPDDEGRVTFTTAPPRVPRAVNGAALTLEPAGGSAVPSDRLLGQHRSVRPITAAVPASAPPVGAANPQ